MVLIFWNKCDCMVTPSAFYLLNTITNFLFPHEYAAISLTNLDCEQSLFGQSRLSSAGMERANSHERGKRECEANESRGEAGEKAGKERGTAFSFVTDAFKFLRSPSIGELDWLINNRMLSARCYCNL